MADIHTMDGEEVNDLKEELSGENLEDAPVPVEPKYGIKETKEALTFVVSFANSAFTYKKFGLGIVANGLFTLMPQAITAITGGDQIPKELGDLDENERIELVNSFRKDFDIPDDQLEAIIERGIGIVSEMAGLTADIKAYSKAAAELKAETEKAATEKARAEGFKRTAQ